VQYGVSKLLTAGNVRPRTPASTCGTGDLVPLDTTSPRLGAGGSCSRGRDVPAGPA